MANILVVDDSSVERRIVASLLEKKANLKATEIDNAKDALALIAQDPPDLIITDLMMPGMDGMALLEKVCATYPGLPVVMMTAFGNEETVVDALRRGAVSYVSKKMLTTALVPTVTEVLDMAQANRQKQRIQAYMTYTEHRFVLENDPKLITPLVGYLQSMMTRRQVCDENVLVQTGIALCEALMNGLYHGNLELSSSLREQGEVAFDASARERNALKPYRDRRLHVTARVSPTEAVYIIRDEGPGFDPSGLPDPTDPDNLEKLSGRGLLLIRTFMDSVAFNETGNEITMVLKKRDSGH